MDFRRAVTSGTILFLSCLSLFIYPHEKRETPLRRITRVVTAPAMVQETGLEIPDVITAMAFDADRTLWLTAVNSGPYLYSISTNEVTNLLRPDYAYGLFPDSQGMWVFTSSGAILYDEQEPVWRVLFPKGVIPLCAARTPDKLYFGTTRGLYFAEPLDPTAKYVGLNNRIHAISVDSRMLFLATEKGLWQYADHRLSMDSSDTFWGLIAADGKIFAARDTDGILVWNQNQRQHVRFAKPSLNMISPGATVLHQGYPYFGAMDGSVLFCKTGNWNRIVTGKAQVTALASNGKALYAWTNGRLLQVRLL